MEHRVPRQLWFESIQNRGSPPKKDIPKEELLGAVAKMEETSKRARAEKWRRNLARCLRTDEGRKR